MQGAYNAVESTEFFDQRDIKVWINAYQYYNIGNTKHGLIPILAEILGGENPFWKHSIESNY